MKVCPTCGVSMEPKVQDVELYIDDRRITVKNIKCHVCPFCGETVYPASEAQKIITVIEANSP